MPKHPSISQELGLVSGQHILEYILEEEIGEGGMGVVWRARHQHLQRRDAIKFIRKRVSNVWLDRFRQEAVAAARVRHQNVITTYTILLANTLREGQPAPDQPNCLPCPAPSAAKADRRVPARGTSISQATARIRLIAVAMIRFWRRVLAIPMYRLRRRSQTRTPWESTPSTPERRA